jgi:hypothetical protein
MSVLIKGLDMPETEYMDIRIYRDGTAVIAIGKKPYYREFETVEVPTPHGRLIDADAFKKENERLLHCDFPYLSETTLEELIDEAPTIDAEPVRHGKWIPIMGLNRQNEKFICSECICQFDYKFNFCPNCGARMDEDD